MIFGEIEKPQHTQKGFLLHLLHILNFLTLKRTIQHSVILFLVLVTYNSNAQENDVDLFVEDMLKIADDFASPAAEGAAYQAGAGWVSSAEGLEVCEVHFSVPANVLFIPGSKKATNTNSNDYSTFNIIGGDQATTPSAFGGATDTSFEGEIDFMGNSLPFSFEAIDGINKSVLMHPFLQAGIGVPFGTEVTVRFLPQLEIDGVNFSTYGIGIKHNFNQYFRFSQPEDFQFAALLAYSKFDVNYEFEPVVVQGVVEFNEIEVDADLWLLQLITSKKFRNPSWSAFGAVGVTNSDFSY